MSRLAHPAFFLVVLAALLLPSCIGEPVRVPDGISAEDYYSPVYPEVSTLDFGESETSLRLTLKNHSGADASYKITSMPSWLTSYDKTGTISKDYYTTIYFSVDRAKAQFGENVESIVFFFEGKTSGSVSVTVKVTKVMPEAPLRPSTYLLDFGTSSTSFSLRLTNELYSDIRFNVTSMPSWLSTYDKSGTISKGLSSTVYFYLDRSKAAVGENTGEINISYEGETTGVVKISVKCTRI